MSKTVAQSSTCLPGRTVPQAANNLRSPAVPSTSHVGGLSVIGRDVLNAANSGFESGTRTPAGSDTGIEYLAKAKLLLQAEMDKVSCWQRGIDSIYILKPAPLCLHDTIAQLDSDNTRTTPARSTRMRVW